jgi:TolA-binding protein
MLYDNSQEAFDPTSAQNLIDEYELFVQTYPQDTMAPAYLFKAAELAMVIRSSAKAIELYGNVYRDYPNHPKAGTSLFLMGFVNDDQVKNLAEAQKYYRLFIAEFPEHNLIDDATFSLQNLGKSDEDIIREFEAMREKANQQDSL